MTRITKNVAIGNRFEGRDPAFLAANGFRSVVCLIECPTNVTARSLGLDALEIFPLRDGPGNDPQLIIMAIRQIARLAVEHPRILVHCVEGVSRSVAVVAGYLMYQFHKTARDAFAGVESKRKQANVHADLRALIERLDLGG